MIVECGFLSLNPSAEYSLLEENGPGEEKREVKEMCVFFSTLDTH